MKRLRLRVSVPRPLLIAGSLACVGFFILGLLATTFFVDDRETKNQAIADLSVQKSRLSEELATLQTEIEALNAEDQRIKNKNLESEIKSIHDTFTSAVKEYEALLTVKDATKKTDVLDKLFADSLRYLSNKNYTSAAASLRSLTQETKKLQDELAATFTIPASVPEKAAPPGSGYSRQKVTIDIGSYLVDIVAGDLSSTRVIVDTAAERDCANDCPVLSLGDYVGRNGAYAGINGSYFCPTAYPSCAGKTNSFDTLLMNKNKVYFNSDNNVYSTVPAVIFLGGSVRFVSRSLDWGRDTGIDSMIANQPLLLSGGEVVFGGDGDPKKGGKGSRSFVGNKGSVVYIGIVHNATVAEVARVLKGMGLDNALNLDSGGSTALWQGGYKVGPGRNIPNAILFVRK